MKLLKLIRDIKHVPSKSRVGLSYRIENSKGNSGTLLSIVEQIISEASIEQLKQQFVDTEKISKKVFNEIVKVTKGKGAYATWMVKRVEDGSIKPEDLYKYEDYIKTFDRYKKQFPSADINTYKDEESVRAFEKKAIEIMEKDVNLPKDDKLNPANIVPKKGIEELKSVGIELIGMVDGYQCFEVPQSLKGSKKAWKVYRKHLAKCSGRGAGARIRICTMASFNRFSGYLADGPYYVFFNLADPKSPYQFSYETSQFMDKDDQPVI